MTVSSKVTPIMALEIAMCERNYNLQCFLLKLTLPTIIIIMSNHNKGSLVSSLLKQIFKETVLMTF